MSLYDIDVVNRETFVQFLDLLQKDFSENPEDWENITIPSFLEAMEAYICSSYNFYKHTNEGLNPENASWKLFADIFLGAKVYE